MSRCVTNRAIEATVDFVVTPFAGDQLNAVAELTGPRRDHRLVLLSDASVWKAVSGTRHRRLVSTKLVRTAARDFSVTAADLRHISPTAKRLAYRIKAEKADIVAVHDAGRWSRSAVAELIKNLRETGKAVLLFTEQGAQLGELATVDPTIAVVGDHADVTVVARAVESADPEPLRLFRVDDARRLRIGDIVATFALPPAIHRYGEWMTPAGEHAPVTGGEPPPVPVVRSVNSKIVAPGTDESVDVAQPLQPATGYELLVNIGPHDEASLLPEPEGRWPAEHLPGGGLELRAVLRMDGMPTPRVARFTLPDAGASFACDCASRADGHDRPAAHDDGCERRPWVHFGLTTPVAPQVWTGELVIYHEVVAVHAQRLVLPVGLAEHQGLHARLLYRLTRSFSELADLKDRTASVLITESGARAMVNGLNFVDNPVSISANDADTAARGARKLLYGLHLEVGRNNEERPKHDQRTFGKPFDKYVADLANLATAGWEIYGRLFAGEEGAAIRRNLPALIRHEAAARGLPAILNVADPTVAEPTRQHPVPWALIYDLPSPSDPASFVPCDSVKRFGPGGGWTGPIPPHCPVSDHRRELNVLCPFGFWGLSCILEQPPSADRPISAVLADTDAPPVAVSLAVGPGLRDDLTTTHLRDLESSLPPRASVRRQDVATPQQLAELLRDETMDVAYLYCHFGYRALGTDVRPSVTLRLDSTYVGPGDITAWSDALWPRPHWPRRKPLILLNGCHTLDMTSATLSNFVKSFTTDAGASGVLGTEVAVEQGMAGWVAHLLLRRLATDNADIGTALREVRWEMLERGNVMGLAYTPFCVSGLRMRPQPEGATS
jgi:hypothetical protein